jgi:cytoskeletal protein CcmA (bactofilin family)
MSTKRKSIAPVTEIVAPPPEPAPIGATTIGAGIRVRGRVTTREPLIVRGRIDAEIRATALVRVEGSGIVNGNLDAAAVEIDGIVVGNVRATDRIELWPNAKVVGDLYSPRLIVHDGARLRGGVDMDGLQALEILKRSPIPSAAPRKSPTPAPKAAIPAPQDVVAWDDPEWVELGTVPLHRPSMAPFAVRTDLPASPPRPDAAAPARLEPAPPPPRPRPKGEKKTGEPDPTVSGSWFRGRH